MKKTFFVGFGAAMLLALSACGNPAPAPLPDDTSKYGGADEYQVSEEYWTNNIEKCGFILGNFSFKMTPTDSNNKVGDPVSVDHGKFAAVTGMGDCYAQVSAKEGCFDVYIKQNDGKYHLAYEEYTAATCAELFASGGFLMTIKFSEVTYNETDHVYECANFHEMTNIKYKFNKGALVETTCKMASDAKATFSDWGSTTVQVPELVVPEKSEALPTVETTYKFTSVECTQMDADLLAQTNELFNDNLVVKLGLANNGWEASYSDHGTFLKLSGNVQNFAAIGTSQDVTPQGGETYHQDLPGIQIGTLFLKGNNLTVNNYAYYYATQESQTVYYLTLHLTVAA